MLGTLAAANPLWDADVGKELLPEVERRPKRHSGIEKGFGEFALFRELRKRGSTYWGGVP
jgi:hypothetical protein